MNPHATPPAKLAVHQPLPHDSASRHVSGEADYLDDLTEPDGTLHAYFGLSERAHAEIASMDLDPVRKAPGVVAVLTNSDLPAATDISSVHARDEPVFAEGKVLFHGQALFAVVAETRDAARRAARLANVEYADLPPVITVEDARAAGGETVVEPLVLKRGDAARALETAPHRITGSMLIGGQEHFYLEGQAAMAIPGEEDEMTVICSTQHPSEIQHMVGLVLGVPSHAVTVGVRRMGGGFGGKETQGNLYAVVAAVAARKLARAVKIRPDRDDDFASTGKRHDFRADYDVGFDDEGRLLALDGIFAGRAGWSADLSGPVTDRALFHADNAYFYPDVLLKSEPLRTNTVSNTAFRGFGGPQGIVGGERVIEEIAYALGKDTLEVRKANFYGTTDRNVTPYHQTVRDNIVHRVVEDLEKSSDYQERRKAILEFNRTSKVIRKGIALTPVKFGISFTATWYNQAGALVHVYRDGSISVNHGGTEMGQGVYIKVAQVVAAEFGVSIDRVRVTETNTSKVPNTSATAASTGSDLNGMAARNACETIKAAMAECAVEMVKAETGDEIAPETVLFEAGKVIAGARSWDFDAFVDLAYLRRTKLFSSGHYATPDISWDRKAGKGNPFFYFAYGASVSEVSIDTLTGEYLVDRVDILHDVGQSLNPGIDLGQVEGGFIQGMGWLTTEEMVWDDKGVLRTHAPSTYKIPLASDVPPIFNVRLAEWSEGPERTIRRSKAVGEPPLMLAVSVLEALSMAVASVNDYRTCPRLDAPATPERILDGVERMRALAE